MEKKFCLNCKIEFIDNSPNKCKLYCSLKCNTNFNRKKINENNRRWRVNHKSQYKKIRSNNYQNNKEKYLIYTLNWIKKNPLKHKINMKKHNDKYKNNVNNVLKIKVHKLVDYDKKKNPNKYKNYCEVCNKTDVRIEQHHEDYTKPYQVIALCRKCHIEIHKKAIK